MCCIRLNDFQRNLGCHRLEASSVWQQEHKEQARPFQSKVSVLVFVSPCFAYSLSYPIPVFIDTPATTQQEGKPTQASSTNGQGKAKAKQNRPKENTPTEGAEADDDTTQDQAHATAPIGEDEQVREISC